MLKLTSHKPHLLSLSLSHTHTHTHTQNTHAYLYVGYGFIFLFFYNQDEMLSSYPQPLRSGRQLLSLPRAPF